MCATATGSIPPSSTRGRLTTSSPSSCWRPPAGCSYLKPDGQIVTSTQQIDPMPVITGAAQYPENLVEKMKAAGAKVDALDCLALAEEAGSSKAVNIVLMGRLSHYFDLPDEAWQKSLEVCVPPKFLELNKKAFQLGKNA